MITGWPWRPWAATERRSGRSARRSGTSAAPSGEPANPPIPAVPGQSLLEPLCTEYGSTSRSPDWIFLGCALCTAAPMPSGARSPAWSAGLSGSVHRGENPNDLKSWTNPALGRGQRPRSPDDRNDCHPEIPVPGSQPDTLECARKKFFTFFLNPVYFMPCVEKSPLFPHRCINKSEKLCHPIQ